MCLLKHKKKKKKISMLKWVKFDAKMDLRDKW